MLCYLFMEKHTGSAYHIRPVLWESPDDITCPLYLEPTSLIMEWLANNGCMMWQPGATGSINFFRMNKFLGTWPEPIELDVCAAKDALFDDSLDKI